MSRSSNQTAASLLVIGLVAAAFHIARGGHEEGARTVICEDRISTKEPS